MVSGYLTDHEPLNTGHSPEETAMTPCERHQAQLLDHLYDLLELGERKDLEVHLAGCEACQGALESARRQQRLIARAAKSRFEAVRFEKPPAEPATPILVLPQERRHNWIRWAAAASVVFLLLGALGVLGGAYWTGAANLHRELAQVESQREVLEHRLNDAMAPAKANQEALAQLLQEQSELGEKQRQAVAEAERTIRSRQRYLRFTGPETIEAGGANPITIEVRDLASDQLVASKLGARLIDEAGREVISGNLLGFQSQKPGEYRLCSLPRDLDLKQNANLYLELTMDEEARARKPGDDKAPEALAALRTALKIARPVYVTHLTTDKPMYQPGETVWFRSLTLERFGLRPAEEPLHLHYAISDANNAEVFKLSGGTQLIDPQTNKPIEGPDKKPLRGVGAGSFPIPPVFAGGEYTLTVSELYNRFPPEKHKFIVNEYQKSPLNMKLEFTKKSYGPGDEVIAACIVEPAGGGRPIARQPVVATVRLDGKTYDAEGKPSDAGLRLQTDDAGAVSVRFRLPTQIEKGEASLSVLFTDGAASDTIVRTVPIILKKFYVHLFPEGGDLVAGGPNRVYFQARTTLDKPADLRGRVVDQDARVVARLETLNDDKEPGVNQGLGVFEFTPIAGKQYSLQIDTPVGGAAEYEFPTIKSDGIVLNTPQGVMAARESLRIRVNDSTGGRSLLVGAYCRGRLLAHQTIRSKKGEFVDVDLRPESGVGGVYRVTVFEETQSPSGRQFVPRAERLVYRAPAERLNLSLRAHRQRYMPAEKAFLSLESQDETGKLAPAILTLAVVDKNVHSMADEKTARSMPTHFYLTTEVRKPEDLEFADFMLGDHAKAAPALDLLLGTQGWRRFAEQDPNKFREKHKEDAARLLAFAAQTPVQANNKADAEAVASFSVQQMQQKLAEEYGKQVALLQEKIASAQQAFSTSSFAANREATELRLQMGTVSAEAGKVSSRLADYNRQWRVAGLIAAGVALVLIGVTGVIIGLLRRGRAAMPYFAAAACSMLVLAVGLVYLSSESVDLVAEPADGMGRRVAQSKIAAPGGDPSQDWTRLKEEREGLEDQRYRERGAKNLPEPKKDADFAFPERARPMDAPAARPAAPPPPAPAGAAPALGDKLDDQMRRVDRLRAGEELKGEAKRDAGLQRHLGTKAADEKLMQQGRLADPKANFAKDKKEAELGGDRRKLPAPTARGGIDGKNLFVPPGRPGGPGGPAGAPSVEAIGPGGRGLGVAGGKPAFGGRGGGGAGFPGGPVGGGFGYQPDPEPLIIREYAHRRTGAPDGVRRDFTETLSWRPVIILNDGSAKVDFELSDSITTFQALAFGHTLDGRLGVGKVEIESRLPFAVDPKIPIEVTASDKLAIPVSVSNETDDRRVVNLNAVATGLRFDGPSRDTLTLDPNAKKRRVFHLKPEIVEGEVMLQIDGRTEGFFSDTVRKTFRVVPDGFPVNGSQSDMLEKIARNEVVLPESWIKGTLKMQVQVYPSTLADLQKGLEGLLREPHGCFEQTSTSNYPNVLILDYLRESDQVRPEVAQRARDLLDRGYQKLTAFECQKQAAQGREGYEWFGGAAPPHEALTAYGLLQFRDMARVYNVDRQMVERTKNYLMSRRDGQGGFTRNPRALDTFGRAPGDITNAYIVWALTESSKDDDLEKELGVLKTQAKASDDPYFLALVANSVLNRGDADFGATLLQKLAAAQKSDGHLDGVRTSITGSGGRHLQIETTALTLLAWLKANRPEFHANVHAAVKWIGQQRGGTGSFGSTQSTILALKALIEHTKTNKRPAEAGELLLHVGDKVEKLQFGARAEEVPALVLKDPEALLKPGKNDVRVEITGNNVFPYTLSWSYQTLKPSSAEGCPVQIETKLSRTSARENETVQLNVAVRNVSGKGQGMTVAIVGLPAGLSLPEDMKQLKDYTRLQENDTKPGRISAWEIRGRELVLYWRDLAPEAKVDVPLELICRVPGEFRGPASRAYLYYNSDTKHWVEPLAIQIEPRD
jgi:hypothetical protein